jgi:hemoglobin
MKMISADELFTRVGRETGVRRLVDRFYDLMDERAEVGVLRDLHPPDLASSRDKLYWFLVGWTGGPPMYEERHGHPRLRMRHLPFSIGDAERNQWMSCMNDALVECIADEEIRSYLSRAFAQIADHMRNRPGG